MSDNTEKEWQDFLRDKTEEEQYLLQERAGIHETHGGATRQDACRLVMEDYWKERV